MRGCELRPAIWPGQARTRSRSPLSHLLLVDQNAQPSQTRAGGRDATSFGFSAATRRTPGCHALAGVGIPAQKGTPNATTRGGKIFSVRNLKIRRNPDGTRISHYQCRRAGSDKSWIFCTGPHRTSRGCQPAEISTKDDRLVLLVLCGPVQKSRAAAWNCAIQYRFAPLQICVFAAGVRPVAPTPRGSLPSQPAKSPGGKELSGTEAPGGRRHGREGAGGGPSGRAPPLNRRRAAIRARHAGRRSPRAALCEGDAAAAHQPSRQRARPWASGETTGG